MYSQKHSSSHLGILYATGQVAAGTVLTKENRPWYCFRKITALFLSISFMLSQSLSQASAAVGGSAQMVPVPASYGRMDGYFLQRSSGKTILLIQDAHDSLEAQENIAHLIRYFVKNHRVHTVFEEGYKGPVPTDRFFNQIPDPGVREKVAYFLMDHLRIGGAEYAHITRKKPVTGNQKPERDNQRLVESVPGTTVPGSKNPARSVPGTLRVGDGLEFKLIGADSFALHQGNIRAYANAEKLAPEVRHDLEAIYHELRELGKSMFSKQFRDWLKQKDRYENGKLGAVEYLKRMLDIRWQMIDEQPITDKQNLKRLLSDLSHLTSAVSDAETAIVARFCKTPDQRRIYDYLETVRLLKKLGQLQMGSKEFKKTKEKLHGRVTDGMARFLADQKKRPVLLPRQWEKRIRDAVEFYETAYARDASIASALDRFLQNKEETSAVLVFGGFHKEAILKNLRERGVTCQTILPKITHVSARHEGFYRKLMRGELFEFEEVAPVHSSQTIDHRQSSESRAQNPEHQDDGLRTIDYGLSSDASRPLSSLQRWQGDPNLAFRELYRLEARAALFRDLSPQEFLFQMEQEPKNPHPARERPRSKRVPKNRLEVRARNPGLWHVAQSIAGAIPGGNLSEAHDLLVEQIYQRLLDIRRKPLGELIVRFLEPFSTTQSLIRSLQDLDLSKPYGVSDVLYRYLLNQVRQLEASGLDLPAIYDEAAQRMSALNFFFGHLLGLINHEISPLSSFDLNLFLAAVDHACVDTDTWERLIRVYRDLLTWVNDFEFYLFVPELVERFRQKMNEYFETLPSLKVPRRGIRGSQIFNKLKLFSDSLSNPNSTSEDLEIAAKWIWEALENRGVETVSDPDPTRVVPMPSPEERKETMGEGRGARGEGGGTLRLLSGQEREDVGMRPEPRREARVEGRERMKERRESLQVVPKAGPRSEVRSQIGATEISHRPTAGNPYGPAQIIRGLGDETDENRERILEAFSQARDRAVQENRKARALVIGVGAGVILYELERLYPELQIDAINREDLTENPHTGIDFNTFLEAVQKSRKSNLEPGEQKAIREFFDHRKERIRLHDVQNGLRVFFRTSYDVIFMPREVFQYIESQSKIRLMEEMRDLLKPDGKALISSRYEYLWVNGMTQDDKLWWTWGDVKSRCGFWEITNFHKGPLFPPLAKVNEWPSTPLSLGHDLSLHYTHYRIPDAVSPPKPDFKTRPELSRTELRTEASQGEFLDQEFHEGEGAVPNEFGEDDLYITRGLQSENEEIHSSVVNAFDRVQKKTASEGRNPKALLVGPGAGVILYELQKKYPEIEFVSLNKAPLKVSSTSFSSALWRARIFTATEDEIKKFQDEFEKKVVLKDLNQESLPFKSESFDIVFMPEMVFQYLDKPWKILKWIQRILKQGGVGLVSTETDVFNVDGLESREGGYRLDSDGDYIWEDYAGKQRLITISKRKSNAPHPVLKQIHQAKKETTSFPPEYQTTYRLIRHQKNFPHRIPRDEMRLVMADFEDVKGFSDDQLKEFAYEATHRKETRFVVYNFDALHPLGRLLKNLPGRPFQLESGGMGQAAKSTLQGFSGTVIHLSSAGFGSQAVAAGKESGLPAHQWISFAYRNFESGTLGLGLRDFQSGRLGTPLKRDLPSYMILDPHHRIVVTDSSQTASFQARYNEVYAIERAA